MSSVEALSQLQQQQVYLHAMGIQRWLPRQPLANAAESADWAADFVWPQQEVLVESTQSSQPSSAQSSTAYQATHSQTAHAKTTHPKMTQESRSDAVSHSQATKASQQSRAAALASLALDESGKNEAVSGKVESTQINPSTPEIELEIEQAALPERYLQPRYSLAFVSAGDLLIVDSLPPHAKNAMTSSYRKLLQGICRALAADFNAETIKLCQWPVFSGPNVNQSGEEAQNAVRRQLEVSLKQHPVKRILLLGEPAAQWLLEQDQSLESMRGLTFSLRSGVKTQVSYSVMHMLKLPEFKADCWRDLQPLL